MSALFRAYVFFVIAVTILLIWWGAAVTTEKVGMAVPGWPLMFGQINPEGWWKVWAYFLEHGHRLIASLVGTLTLILFAVRFVRSWPAAAELGGLVVLLGFTTWTVHKQWYSVALIGAAVCVGWLVFSWARRGWPLVTKLAALALILVSLQASLGGIRVLENSNLFATVHGCLAQIFFCVLVLIAFASGKGWDQPGSAPTGKITRLRWLTIGLLSAVFVQLILGAAMRHHQRFGIADDGILTTGAGWFPKESDVPAEQPASLTGDERLTYFDFVVLFLHKWWATIVFALAFGCAIWTWARFREQRGIRRLAAGIGWLVVVQLLLGVSVIVGGKSFWITNFHVLNGLAILTLSFCLAVKALRVIPLANDSASANVG